MSVFSFQKRAQGAVFHALDIDLHCGHRRYTLLGQQRSQRAYRHLYGTVGIDFAHNRTAASVPILQIQHGCTVLSTDSNRQNIDRLFKPVQRDIYLEPVNQFRVRFGRNHLVGAGPCRHQRVIADIGTDIDKAATTGKALTQFRQFLGFTQPRAEQDFRFNRIADGTQAQMQAMIVDIDSRLRCRRLPIA